MTQPFSTAIGMKSRHQTRIADVAISGSGSRNSHGAAAEALGAISSQNAIPVAQRPVAPVIHHISRRARGADAGKR